MTRKICQMGTRCLAQTVRSYFVLSTATTCLAQHEHAWCCVLQLSMVFCVSLHAVELEEGEDDVGGELVIDSDSEDDDELDRLAQEAPSDSDDEEDGLQEAGAGQGIDQEDDEDEEEEDEDEDEEAEEEQGLGRKRGRQGGESESGDEEEDSDDDEHGALLAVWAPLPLTAARAALSGHRSRVSVDRFH